MLNEEQREYIRERVSMVVTTNLRFGEWNTIFGTERMTAAFLDRLTYKSHTLPRDAQRGCIAEQ